MPTDFLDTAATLAAIAFCGWVLFWLGVADAIGGAA